LFGFILQKKVRVITANKNRNVLPQVIGLTILLLLLVCASVMVVLMMTGTVDIENMPENKDNPVSEIVDAEKICNQQVRFDYAGRLNSIVHDERSGRYNKSTDNFTLFYHLEVYRDESKQTGTSASYVVCNIASVDGSISQIEYLEDLEEKAKASKRDDTNIFGL
jgi:hypothetical protein